MVDIGSLKFYIEAIDRVTKPLQNIGKEIDKLATTQIKYNKKLGDWTKQTVSFNASWLSLLFLGMSMSRMFKGLTSEIRNLYLATATADLNLTLAASTAFLFEPLESVIYALSDAFMLLPEPIAGFFAAILAGIPALGSFIVGFSQFMMGVQAMKGLGVLAALKTGLATLMTVLDDFGWSLIFATKGALAPFAAGIGPIIVAIAAVIAIILIIIGFVLVLKEAWSDNFMGMKDKLGTMWAFAKPVLTFFWKLIETVGVILWQAFRVTAYAAITFFMTAFEVMWEIAKMILRTFGFDVENLEKNWSEGWGSMSEGLEKFQSIIEIVANAIIGGMERMGEDIGSVFEHIGGGIGKVIQFFEDLKTKASAAWNGLMDNLKIPSWAKEAIGLIAGGPLGIAKGIGGAVKGLFGFQQGGVVPISGAYGLHAGETVIPAGGSAGMSIGEINIFAGGGVSPSAIYDEFESRLRVENARRRI